MRELLQSSTDKVINFYMVDSTDHITEETGLTVAVALSKNGAAFGAAAGAVAEVGNGIYKLTPTDVDTGTLGPLVARATAAGADNNVVETNIVANDPYTADGASLNKTPMIVKQGQTDVTTYFKLINATTGLPEVGLVAADIALEYIRDRDLSIPIIAGDISRAQDHEDGGIVGFSNGIYRVDWPDAAFASGVDKVQLMVIGDDIDIAIMEAELEIISDSLFPDEVFDPAAGTIRYNKKGTVTQLSKKDLKDPAGDPVNSTEDIIAEATEQ